MVLAMESTNRPEMPKSQSLNSPSVLTRTLEGFTSTGREGGREEEEKGERRVEGEEGGGRKRRREGRRGEEG